MLGTIDAGLDCAAGKLQARLAGQRRYGWCRKSIGSKAILRDGTTWWLRLQASNVTTLNSRLWDGDRTAPQQPEIRRPRIHRVLDWTDGDLSWRAILMTLVAEGPCSETPDLGESLKLDAAWYEDIRLSLDALKPTKTERVCVRQDLIDRRIKERYGHDVDTTISRWVACHGDLHWRNLTCPRLYILDWEAWGLGPFGLDEASLLGYAGRQPKIATALEERFRSVLSTRDGLVATLFVCAELLRMIELHGDHPLLRASLETLGSLTLTKVRRLHRNGGAQ